MTEPDALLEDVAAAVLDGAPINWDLVESKVHESDRSNPREAESARHHQGRAPRGAASDRTRRPKTGARSALSNLWGTAHSATCIAPGTRARSRGGAEAAAARRAAVDRNRGHHEEGVCSRASGIPMSSLSMAPNGSTAGSGCGWSSSRGEPSRSCSRRAGASPPSEVVVSARFLSRGLGGPQGGLLHRDIKAQNVMMADDGRVVLMDFGAGRELSCEIGASRGRRSTSRQRC